MATDNVRIDTDVKNRQGKVVPVLNQAPRHEDLWRIGGTGSQILKPQVNVEGSGRLHTQYALRPRKDNPVFTA